MPPANAALATIEEAFDRFKSTVSVKDAYQFQHTELEDVHKAAREVEKQLAARGEARALARLRPLLAGLGHYSEAVAILCNGTPYLPWVWAPIKLFLQIATDYLSAFDKLIKAYSEIADVLPRFDRLSTALASQPEFQAVLAVFYCDLLDFHRRAYKFFRASAWKRFWDSSWARFDIRFKGVIESIKYHAELVDKEANAQNIATVQEWRENYLDDVERREKQRSDDQFEKVLQWLDLKDYLQEDDLDGLLCQCHKGTTDWLSEHDKLKDWKCHGGQNRLFWLNGKPGSGKSVLFAKTIDQLREEKKSTIAFFICNFRSPDRNTCSNFLRSIASQLIKRNRTMVGLVYDDYVLQGLTPAKKCLKNLIMTGITSMTSLRVLIDGLDECLAEEQKEILVALRDFTKNSSSSNDCKAAVFSRDFGLISHQLSSKGVVISLKTEGTAVAASIKSYVHHEVQDIRDQLDDDFGNDSLFQDLESKIVSKADGMFLWVRLMLAMLRELHSIYDLEIAVDSLPSGLEEAYDRILQRIRANAPHRFRKVMTAFAWIAFANRPLKTHELLDGIALSTPPYRLDDKTRLSQQELDRYKPLVEFEMDGAVSFAHSSVREYILDHSSGPFLKTDAALSDVAVGCASYMNSSLDLVDPAVAEKDRVKAIALGFHGLHRYATAEWLKHLEQLSNTYRTQDIRPEPQLMTALQTLSRRHTELQQLRVLNDQVITIDHVHSRRLLSFDTISGLCSIASIVWEYEGGTSYQTIEDDLSQQTAEASLFCSETAKSYSVIAAALLADGSETQFPYIPEAYLRRFRSLYGDTTFPCRLATCAHRSQGFATEEARNAHERTHESRFYCPEQSCPFSSAPGFRAPALLKRHKNSYHADVGQDLRDFLSSNFGFRSGRNVRTSNATPASQSERPLTPTPATPITPMNPKSVTDQLMQNGQLAPALNQVKPQANSQDREQQQNAKAVVQSNATAGLEPFGSFKGTFKFSNNDDILENFDFDSFLKPSGYTSNESSTFDGNAAGSSTKAEFQPNRVPTYGLSQNELTEGRLKLPPERDLFNIRKDLQQSALSSSDNVSGSKVALKDYQVPPILLEQQNKRRLMKQRIEEQNQHPSTFESRPRDQQDGPESAPSRDTNRQGELAEEIHDQGQHIENVEQDLQGVARQPNQVYMARLRQNQNILAQAQAWQKNGHNDGHDSRERTQHDFAYQRQGRGDVVRSNESSLAQRPLAQDAASSGQILQDRQIQFLVGDPENQKMVHDLGLPHDFLQKLGQQAAYTANPIPPRDHGRALMTSSHGSGEDNGHKVPSAPEQQRLDEFLEGVRRRDPAYRPGSLEWSRENNIF